MSLNSLNRGRGGWPEIGKSGGGDRMGREIAGEIAIYGGGKFLRERRVARNHHAIAASSSASKKVSRGGHEHTRLRSPYVSLRVAVATGSAILVINKKLRKKG